MTHRGRAARRLRRRWFVATAIAVRLLAETAGAAWAEDSPVSASRASDAANGQPRASARAPLGQRWDNFQKELDNRGIQLGVRYDGEVFADASGGLRCGAAYLGNLNLQLTLDAERLTGWTGGTVFLYGLGIHGGRPSKRFAGDAQGVSSIEAPAKWKLEEGWIQQNLFDNRFSVLAGRYDLNSEFYRLQSAGLFLNSSFGMGPEFSQSGREGPSIFPDTAVGARFALKPIEEVVLRTAVLDGVPVERPNGAREIFARDDGALVVAEAAYLYRPVGPDKPRTRAFRIGRNCCGTYTGKLALGGWYYSAAFDDLTKTHANGRPVRRRGSGGGYVIADGTVYQDAQNPDRRAALFGQLGIGDPRVNRFAYYTGGGLTVSALIPGRGQDELGIGVAAAHNGSPFMAAERKQGLRERRSETALELTYLAQFGSRLAVQPDLQYVIDPNTDPRIKNALAFMLRFELSF